MLFFDCFYNFKGKLGRLETKENVLKAFLVFYVSREEAGYLGPFSEVYQSEYLIEL